MTAYGFNNFKKMNSSQDKGQFNQFQLLLNSFKNGNHQLIPFLEIVNTTQVTFAAIDSILQNRWIDIVDV